MRVAVVVGVAGGEGVGPAVGAGEPPPPVPVGAQSTPRNSMEGLLDEYTTVDCSVEVSKRINDEHHVQLAAEG
jgi:hypothetical protein